MNDSPLRELVDAPGFAEATQWQRTAYAAGSQIVKEGDAAREVFLVLEGTVRVLGTVSLDEQRVLRPGFCDLGPGQMFGELCLFDDQPRSASVIAVTDCEVAVVEGGRLLDYLDAHPEVGYPVLRYVVSTLVDRLRTANRRFVSVFSWGLKAHRLDQHL